MRVSNSRAISCCSHPFGERADGKPRIFTENRFFKNIPAIPEIHLYHCLNDPVVPVEHAELYTKRCFQALPNPQTEW
jgi:hypothetical protein